MTDIDSEVLDWNQLVACQEGSIVSRKIIAQPGGNVTLFAFAAGEELSEHTTPYDALLHVVDGEAVVRIEATQYTVGAGRAIILPAGRPHAVRAEQPFRMLLTMVRSPAPAGQPPA